MGERQQPPSPPSGFRGRVVASGNSQVSNGNIANIITVVRILLAPLFVWLVLLDGGEHGLWRFIAAGLFIVAIATDGLDGALARKRNLVTNSGIILDPIADKILIGGALIALALVAELPWWVVIVILAREIGITLFRLMVLSDRVIPASRGGKLKTVLQAVTLSSWLVPTWLLLGSWVFTLNWVLMGAVIVVTVVTGLDYWVKGLRSPKAPS
ncbi:MAG TPA: CDP-diacylglycerol--glycerol-3-phosphate 3-phosphatidyltransferase [Pontimonas sp.]|nr:CDP-diacylglycerol--glycerol-3-phosphate 3-phosphatidyltransferase [Pontimonas sp.]